jgi:hypothetical protein
MADGESHAERPGSRVELVQEQPREPLVTADDEHRIWVFEQPCCLKRAWFRMTPSTL